MQSLERRRRETNNTKAERAEVNRHGSQGQKGGDGSDAFKMKEKTEEGGGRRKDDSKDVVKLLVGKGRTDLKDFGEGLRQKRNI